MGFPPSSTPNHLYSQALQLKLYQAFIFSIPILFSIILFLLFYLFYLKRRATSLSSPIQILPTDSNQRTSYVPFVCPMALKKEIRDKLPIVLFDEELGTKESQLAFKILQNIICITRADDKEIKDYAQIEDSVLEMNGSRRVPRHQVPKCCVCLGEFQIKEELLQIPTCKHVFHIECIHHWLHSNSTCPLCRSFVIPTTKIDQAQVHSDGPETPLDTDNSNQNTQNASPEQQQQQQEVGDSVVIAIEESSSAETCSMDPEGYPELSMSIENRMDHRSQESVAVHIQT